LRRGCQPIRALAASRNPFGGRGGGAYLMMSPTPIWRVLVSVSSQGTIIFWKSSLNKGFEPTPPVSPVMFSPKANWSDKGTPPSAGNDYESPYSIVPNPKPKRGTAVAM